MLIAIPGVKRNARSEALCSLLYIKLSFIPIAIHGVDTHGVKLYARCFTWSEASCSMLYME